MGWPRIKPAVEWSLSASRCRYASPDLDRRLLRIAEFVEPRPPMPSFGVDRRQTATVHLLARYRPISRSERCAAGRMQGTSPARQALRTAYWAKSADPSGPGMIARFCRWSPTRRVYPRRLKTLVTGPTPGRRPPDAYAGSAADQQEPDHNLPELGNTNLHWQG